MNYVLGSLPMCDQLSRARPGESTLPQTWQQTSSMLMPIRFLGFPLELGVLQEERGHVSVNG